jgi:hypothetical protein
VESGAGRAVEKVGEMSLTRFLVVLVAVLVVARPAYAYVDPNASSVLLQLILGGVAGVGIALRLFWGRIRGMFGGKPKDDSEAARGGER